MSISFTASWTNAPTTIQSTACWQQSECKSKRMFVIAWVVHLKCFLIMDTTENKTCRDNIYNDFSINAHHWSDATSVCTDTLELRQLQSTCASACVASTVKRESEDPQVHARIVFGTFSQTLKIHESHSVVYARRRRIRHDTHMRDESALSRIFKWCGSAR